MHQTVSLSNFYFSGIITSFTTIFSSRKIICASIESQVRRRGTTKTESCEQTPTHCLTFKNTFIYNTFHHWTFVGRVDGSGLFDSWRYGTEMLQTNVFLRVRQCAGGCLQLFSPGNRIFPEHSPSTSRTVYRGKYLRVSAWVSVAVIKNVIEKHKTLTCCFLYKRGMEKMVITAGKQRHKDTLLLQSFYKCLLSRGGTFWMTFLHMWLTKPLTSKQGVSVWSSVGLLNYGGPEGQHTKNIA